MSLTFVASRQAVWLHVCLFVCLLNLTFVASRQAVWLRDARTLFPSVFLAVGVRRGRWLQLGTGGTAHVGIPSHGFTHSIG